mgnify:CR=1 FL=1
MKGKPTQLTVYLPEKVEKWLNKKVENEGIKKSTYIVKLLEHEMKKEAQ